MIEFNKQYSSICYPNYEKNERLNVNVECNIPDDRVFFPLGFDPPSDIDKIIEN